MKLKMKRTLATLIMINVLTAGTSFCYKNNTKVLAKENKSDHLIDEISGASENINMAFTRLKNKVDEAEKLYNNFISNNKDKTSNASVKEFKQIIEYIKSKLKTVINKQDIIQMRNNLEKEIVIFKAENLSNSEQTNIKENKNEINIKFSIVGKYDEIIHQPKNLVIKGQSVEDILKSNNINYKLDNTGIIKSINGIKNGIETNDKFYDKNSKWICLVNGKKIEQSIKYIKISDKDYIMLYYGNDSNIPNYSADKNDFISVNIKAFDLEAKKQVDSKFLVLKSTNEYFIARKILNKMGVSDKDINYYPATQYIKVDDMEVRVIINEDSKTVRKVNSPINEGDNIVVYQKGGNYSEAPYFSKVKVSSDSVNKGEKIKISVYKVDEDWNEEGTYDYQGAGKVRVYFGDKTYTTDDKGEVNIQCNNTGEFEVYADSDEMLIKEGLDDYYENYILPSNKVKVIVKENNQQTTNTGEKENKNELNVNFSVVGKYDEIIYQPKNLVIKGQSVEDILKSNNINYELDNTGIIKSINGIKNGIETNDKFYDKNSKWICLVNGKKIEQSIKDIKISDKDYIMLYYGNNSNIPNYSVDKNYFISVNIKAFDLEAKKQVDSKFLVLKSTNEYFIAKKILNKMGVNDKNIKYYPATQYIKANDLEVRVIINEDDKTVKNILSPINEGDNIVVYQKGGDYYDAPYFSKVKVSANSVNKGEKIKISVKKLDESYDEEGTYVYQEAGKVRVYFGDKTYTTDDKGNVTVECNDVGQFEVYADSDEMLIKEGLDDYYENYILPSNKIKVIVNGEDENISVDKDKELDKKELLNLINDAKMLYKNSEEGNTEGKYKKENKDKLLEAVNSAINISLDKNTTQEKVNIEIEKLKNSIEKLKNSIVRIDSVKLKKLLDEALQIFNNSAVGSEQGQYSKDVKENFEKEVIRIRKVYNNKNKIQQDVDNAVEELQLIIENYKKSRIDITQNFELKAVNLPKELKKGTSAQLTINAINNTNDNKNVCLIVGVFDNDDKLIKYSAVKQVIKKGQNSQLTAVSKLPNESGCKVKAFVWDGLESMNALSNILEIKVK